MLTRGLREKNIEAENLKNADDIFEKIKYKIKEKNMVVIMSNGNFGNLDHRLADFLNKN